MKTIQTITIAAVTLTLVAETCGAADEVSGKWKADFQSPIGQLKYIYELKADGAKLAGKAIRTLEGAKTETEIKEGKLSGADVSFVEVLQIQDQDIRIEYKGKLAGGEIKFTRKVATSPRWKSSPNARRRRRRWPECGRPNSTRRLDSSNTRSR